MGAIEAFELVALVLFVRFLVHYVGFDRWVDQIQEGNRRVYEESSRKRTIHAKWAESEARAREKNYRPYSKEA